MSEPRQWLEQVKGYARSRPELGAVLTQGDFDRLIRIAEAAIGEAEALRADGDAIFEGPTGDTAFRKLWNRADRMEGKA